MRGDAGLLRISIDEWTATANIPTPLPLQTN